MARANTAQIQEDYNSESSDKDDERKVYASLQKFCNEGFAKVTRKVMQVPTQNGPKRRISVLVKQIQSWNIPIMANYS